MSRGQARCIDHQDAGSHLTTTTYFYEPEVLICSALEHAHVQYVGGDSLGSKAKGESGVKLARYEEVDEALWTVIALH